MSCELRPFPGKTLPPLQNSELPRKHKSALPTSAQPCESCHEAAPVCGLTPVSQVSTEFVRMQADADVAICDQWTKTLVNTF